MLKITAATLAAGLAVSLYATAASAVTTVSFEAPGVENTTISLAGFSAVETFSTPPYGAVFGGTYIKGKVLPASKFGGAGGIGKFFSSSKTATLTLGSTATYFGLYASAINATNAIAFYNGATLVDSYNVFTLTAPLSNAYKANPDLGGNVKQKYAFINFAFSGAGYDKVVLSSGAGGAFESDNHTVGFALVPEPATWAMMVAGFGLVGFGLRRRSKSVVLA